MEPIKTISDLIRKARNGQNQKDFAEKLGIKQSSLSRYERGKTNPPVKVIEDCMRLVHTDAPPPTADELANRVRSALADPGMGQVRSAISRLVDAVTHEHQQQQSSNI